MSEVTGTFSDLFEGWVDRAPEHLAVVTDEGESRSYAELEAAANRLANAIDAADPERAKPTVAIALDQGLDAIVAIVAGAKSGRTVVPVDPENPPVRVAEILEQVPPAVVLLTAADEPALRAVPRERRSFLHVEEVPADARSERVVRPKDADTWSLVIFTSGSTGRPKGVVYTFGQSARARPRGDDLWSRPGTVYGVAVEHQWLAGYGGIRNALTTGGTIAHYATRRRGPAGLCRFLAEHGVHLTGGTPSIVRAMLDADPDTMLPDLRVVTFLGDTLRRDLVVDLYQRVPAECIVTTSYASSEAGGVASLHITKDTIPDGDIVPAGRIVEGVDVEIEDPDDGGVGRIVVVTGQGSQGYVRDQGVGDVIEELEDGRKRHRTGDLGRLRPDGMLEVLGRYAFLVKVRGQRVDAVEVEAALRQVPGVTDAVVGVHADDPSARLTAWYVAGDPAPNVGDLRAHLRPRLPTYMIPAAYLRLDELPRGSRGKLAREALPVPDDRRPDLGHPYEAPSDDLEAAVAGAFSKILGVEEVGRSDAFFDLGGDSLGAAEVMTLLSADLGRDLPLSVFVEASTPAQLAARLRTPEVEQQLVTLRSGGAGAPIYCVHGGGGQVLSFARLAEQLGAEHPFVGVQMRQSDRARSLFRVDRLAARYAGQIAARQGSDPCIVAGHSYGGVVAVALSRRLAQRGVPVEACVLLDTYVPRRRLLGGAQRRRIALGVTDATTNVKEALYAVHALLGLRPRPHRVTTERMIAAMWGMSWHRPRPTPAPLVLVRAVDQPLSPDPEAWRLCAPSGLTVLEVPGDHHSMLAPPHVDRLAEVLANHIDRSPTV